MSVEHTLSAPLMGPDGPVHKITISRPKARHFQRYGQPFKIRQTMHEDGSFSSEVEFFPKAIIGFLSDMSGLDPIAFEEIDGYDYDQLADKLIGLIKRPPTPSA